MHDVKLYIIIVIYVYCIILQMGVSQAIRSRFKEFNRVRPQCKPEQEGLEPKAKKAKVSSKMPMSTVKRKEVRMLIYMYE